jgi:hypothetical protein
VDANPFLASAHNAFHAGQRVAGRGFRYLLPRRELRHRQQRIKVIATRKASGDLRDWFRVIIFHPPGVNANKKPAPVTARALV